MAYIYEQPRVILWSVPRSCTTAVLRSISNLEGGVIYHEPFEWAFMRRLKGDSDATNLTQRAPAGQTSADYALDLSTFTYPWVKKTLEAEHKDASLVFVKDFAFSLAGQLDMDHLPHGYRHSFLIRNPNKVIPSLKKSLEEWKPIEIPPGEEAARDWHKTNMGEHGHYDKLWELFQYVRENLDPTPFVMDADDLVSQPETVMAAYCKATGIPFSKKLLDWEKDGSPMHTKWITCRNELGFFENAVYHANVRSTSCFKKSEDLPKPALTSITDPEVIKQITSCMPYYEKLYLERFVP